jgi:hypothetical protein
MNPGIWVCGAAFAVFATLTGGCVSSGTYERSQAALNAERQAHAQARLDEQALRAQLAELGGELTAARAATASQEQRIAQDELDASVVRQERDRMASLVEDLRGELGRASDHLRAFSGQKRQLEQALNLAQRAVVVKDLTLALPRPVAPGKADVMLAQGEPVIRVPADEFWERESDLIGAVAGVAELHPETRLEVRLPSGSPPESEEALRQKLRARGLVDKRFLVAAQADAAGAQVELRLSSP